MSTSAQLLVKRIQQDPHIMQESDRPSIALMTYPPRMATTNEPALVYVPT